MNEKKDKKLPFKTCLSHNWFMFRIIFSASPLYGIMLIIESLRHNGLIFVESTLGVGYILSCVEFGKPFMDVFRFLMFLFALLALSGLYSSVFNSVVAQRSMPLIEQKLKYLLYEKAGSLDLACYDDPEYYNEFVLAVAESRTSLERSTQLIRMIFSGFIMLVCYGGYFLAKDPISVIFVGVSFLARFFLMGVANKLRYSIRLKENPLLRKRNYINRAFYLHDYAKELRMNKNVAKKLHDDFKKTNDGVYEAHKSSAKKLWLLDFLINYAFSDLIIDGLYLAYLVFQAAIRHAISFSSLVVLYNSAGNLRRGLQTLTDIFPFAQENALYVDKIRTFLNYEVTITSEKKLPVPESIDSICFEHVCFSYQENQNDILHDINLVLHAREKIALVGYNGAGKTTLIKLLMRLYDPTSGRITLNGIDIRNYDVDEYRNQIGTVFQDYQIYAATLEENVYMDESKQDDIAVTDALIQSGFEKRLSNMPDKLTTSLTREFDSSGTNLSGGESQKVAIARVFYKKANLIILDEPSSALDPIAEYQLNYSMAKASHHKTVLFISHRLSTTRHADRILMLEKGQIIEEGTHDELLKEQGKYAEMWQAQASRYV